MLDPEERQVYLHALKAPDGYHLGEAIATTYSLDLFTLLWVPVALTLPHIDTTKLGPENVLELLQALQHASSRLTVFCDQGGILAPAGEHVLYAMLERVVLEARAPHGGAFHPKLWFIRFDPEPGSEAAPCLRLVVLSRNLTNDRCWDIALMLDGTVGRRRRAKDALADLLVKLPAMALRAPETSVLERAQRLAEDAARADWELPVGFDAMQLHVLGTGKKPKPWIPEPSDRLVVISPFVRTTALTALVQSTRDPLALVARSEELDRVDPKLLRDFENVYVLHDDAQRDDGEDGAEGAANAGLRGLHAKVYLAKRGWNTHIYVGSANATHAALTDGINVEVMVELSGRTSAVPGKGIDGLLDDDGFRKLLSRYELLEQASVIDPGAARAEKALRSAICELAQAKLSIGFTADGDEYQPTLRAAEPLLLAGIREARAWLVTGNPSTARDVLALRRGPVNLARCAAAGATCFVAFELLAEGANVYRLFSLNVPAIDMPSDRDAHIARVVVKNKERLVQYILSLLEGADPYVQAGIEFSDALGAEGRRSGPLGAGLLEQLVRTKARSPERLDEVGHVLHLLMGTEDGRKLVPPELLELWNVVTGEVLP